jgi:hypothetical protein
MSRDYEDRSYGAPPELSGMDKFFRSTAVGVIFALIGVFCCPLISIILGGIGMATCKNPGSKQNAMIALIGGVIGIVLNIVLMATGVVDYRNLGGAR